MCGTGLFMFLKIYCKRHFKIKLDPKAHFVGAPFFKWKVSLTTSIVTYLEWLHVHGYEKVVKANHHIPMNKEAQL